MDPITVKRILGDLASRCVQSYITDCDRRWTTPGAQVAADMVGNSPSARLPEVRSELDVLRACEMGIDLAV
jgi:hypothetical protein